MTTSAMRLSRSGAVTDYLGLARPKSILPHLLTAAAAMFLAAGGIPPAVRLLLTLVGGGVVAAAANTLNSYLDRDIDALMARTRRRPLPSGRVKPEHAVAMALALGVTGVLTLNVFANWIAATLALAALAYYVFPYTLWLKRRTYWSSVVGSGVGALAPLIGWVAITPRIELTPLLLSAIIVFWTIPHFWTLAIYRRDDYERAGLAMLPSTGVGGWLLVSSSMLILASLSIVPVADLSFLYLTAASILGAGVLALVLKTYRGGSPHAALLLHRYSVFYVAALFVAMILDRLVL